LFRCCVDPIEEMLNNGSAKLEAELQDRNRSERGDQYSDYLQAKKDVPSQLVYQEKCLARRQF